MGDMNKVTVIFKEANMPVLDWLRKKSDEEDVSMNAFIIRALKKLMKEELNPSIVLQPLQIPPMPQEKQALLPGHTISWDVITKTSK